MKFQYLIVAIFFGALSASYLLGFTPLAISTLIMLISAITYLIYAKDKKAAKERQWRVAESTLQFLSLIGGWPGAIVAQQRLRHKTKKVSFQVFFLFVVALNVSGLAWLHFEKGSNGMRNVFFQIENFAFQTVDSDIDIEAILFFTTFRPQRQFFNHHG